MPVLERMLPGYNFAECPNARVGHVARRTSDRKLHLRSLRPWLRLSCTTIVESWVGYESVEHRFELDGRWRGDDGWSRMAGSLRMEPAQLPN